MNLAFPKPKDQKKKPVAVRVFRDSREVCNLLCKAGADEYQNRKKAMWERQGRRCILQLTSQCKARQGRWPIDEVTFDHENGRGAGGSKRDDRIEVDGKPQNAAVCWGCNSAKASRRVPYLIDAP